MTILNRTEFESILEYIEETAKPRQHEIFVAYCNEVHAFRKFLEFYFKKVKGQFDHSALGDVPYDMPAEHSPAYSSIARNMTRIEAIVDTKTPLADKRALKLATYSSLSVGEILLMENVFDSTLEEYFPGIDWDDVKTYLKV